MEGVAPYIPFAEMLESRERVAPPEPHGYMLLPLAGWLQSAPATGSPWQEVTMVSLPLMPEEQWTPI